MGLGNFFKKIFGFFKSDAFKKDLEIISAWSELVLPIVEQIADATESKTDGQVVAWAKIFIPEFKNLASSPAAREAAIRAVARVWVARDLKPEIADRLIDSAIQLAYVAYRRGA